MPRENGPENREPEDLMGDEDFYYIHTLMGKNLGLSEDKIAAFVKKYSEGGMDFVRMKDAQTQERREFRIEQIEDLKKQVPDMTNDELYQHYAKAVEGLALDDTHMGDPFSHELFSRLKSMEKGERDKEYARLKSLYGKTHKEK